MDFSKFSHDDFDVKGWVNGALEAYKENQSSLDVMNCSDLNIQSCHHVCHLVCEFRRMHPHL